MSYSGRPSWRKAGCTAVVVVLALLASCARLAIQTPAGPGRGTASPAPSQDRAATAPAAASPDASQTLLPAASAPAACAPGATAAVCAAATGIAPSLSTTPQAAGTPAASAGPVTLPVPHPGDIAPATVPATALAEADAPVQPLAAWIVSPVDGSVFVLDAAQRVWRLAPRTLAVQSASPPLFPAGGARPAYLVDAGPYLLAGSEAVTRTLVLDKQDYRPLAAWERAGPLAADPGRRAYMAWERGLWAYDLANLAQPPAVLTAAPLLGMGAIPVRMAVDLGTRQLYVVYHNVDASPPHQRESYHVYSLDTPGEPRVLRSELGWLERPSFAGQAGRVVGALHAKNGFLGSRLLVYDGAAAEPRTGPAPLEGVPAVDPTGRHIYLLRERGLWVLDGDTLALQSVKPITTTPPVDLAPSPDGGTLYLFGNGWLAAWPTAELAGLSIPPFAGPFPAAWITPEATDYFRPHLFRSPTYEVDSTAFVTVGGYGEMYRTTDSGRTWQFLPELSYPDLRIVRQLSLSPDFAVDHTLTAHPAMLRSTDAGTTWQAFEPRIAFYSDRDGSRQIYTANQDGSDACRITDGAGSYENPAWSPAWTRLAFQTRRAGAWELATLRADCIPAAGGRGYRVLTPGSADSLLPAWSPDGRSIAFVSTRDGNPELYTLPYGSLAGSAVGTPRGMDVAARRLTVDAAGDWRPAWESDGLHLVFTSGRSGRNGIFRLAPEDSNLAVTPLVSDASDNRDPAMNRDGMLAFLSDRDGPLRVYTLDTAYSSGQIHLLNSSPQAMGHPAWIDTGLELLVTADRAGADGVYRAGYGESLQPVITAAASNGQPAWGPPLWLPNADTSAALLAQR